MNEQEYVELGFSKEDAEFLEAYPKVYPIASVMGIQKSWIDDLFDKMEYSPWIYGNLDHNSKQLHLSMCMKRLHHFKMPFDFESFKNADIDTIEKVFGKYNIRFVIELLQVI